MVVVVNCRQIMRAQVGAMVVLSIAALFCSLKSDHVLNVNIGVKVPS